MMWKPEKRRYPRVPMTLNKAAVTCGGKSANVTIENISRSGVLFHTDQQFALGDIVTMNIAGVYRRVEFNEHVPGRVVTVYRRSEGNSYGIQFSILLYADCTPALAAFLDRRKRDRVSFLRDPRYGRAERKH